MDYYGDAAFPSCGESVTSNRAGMAIDQEAACHMTSANRKQREMNARGQLPFSLLLILDPRPWGGRTHI